MKKNLPFEKFHVAVPLRGDLLIIINIIMIIIIKIIIIKIIIIIIKITIVIII